MSYGVWKHKSVPKSPVKWSLINLDHGSWNCGYWDDYRTEKPKIYYMLGAQGEKLGLLYENAWGRDKTYRLRDDSLPDDPSFVGWAVYQLKAGRTLYQVATGGDHGVYFSCMPDDYEEVIAQERFRKYCGYEADSYGEMTFSPRELNRDY